MTNLAHIAETALLLLAAYLLGCGLGYGIRLVLYVGRGTRQVAPPAAAVATPASESYRPRSSAARLAARVDPLPPTPTPSPPLATPPAVAAPPAAPIQLVEATKLAQKRTPAAKPVSKSKSSDPKPATLAQPPVGGPDNLKQIKGIGPKIEASLHAMGIFHVDQIAGWSKANIDWVDAQLSFKGRIRRERWVEQAQELSKTKTVA